MPLDHHSAVRIVPSGQIYRQLFDAQLQLNQSLSRFDSDYRFQRQKSRKLSHSNLPLVRLNNEDTSHGILSSRQKAWVEGLPNDPYTENPVVYKQFNEYLNQKLQNSRPSKAGWEVQGLPDVLVSAKQDSDIVARVSASKRQRHESTVEDMYQALSIISMKTEILIEKSIAALLDKLATSDEDIANIQASIENDEDIIAYQQLPDLCVVWEKIKAHATQRQSWIDEMSSNLKKIEEDRINKIREVFANYGQQLKSISYLLLPDLQRFLDKESQLINQTVLSNHRSYADISVRLIAADVEREKIQHTAFLKRVEDWKILKTRNAIESFKEFMETEAVVQPQGIKIVKMKILSDQQMLNNQRLEIIKTLCDMQPPNSTKVAVFRCRQDLKRISEELDKITQMHMIKLHEEYEQVCQQCLEKIDIAKLAMMKAGICSRHKVNQVIDEFMLPLVGKQQRMFENDLESMQKMTEEHTDQMEEEINLLFNFAQGAANVWDVHEVGLAKLEKELQEHLENSRHHHDQSIQEKEANLDIVMDRMRQDGSEVELKDSLLKALTMLVKIKDSYEDFHDLQTHVVKEYPAMVKGELDEYVDAVCRYFSVSRVVAEVVQEEDSEKEETDVEMKKLETNDSSIDNVVTQSDKDNVVTQSDKDNVVTRSISLEYQAPLLEKEIIYSHKGTGYYVLPDDVIENMNERDGEDEDVIVNVDQAFQADEGEPDKSWEDQASNMPDFIQSINIPTSLILEIKKAIRMRFLDHLDDWSQQAILRANSVVTAKCEELNSELDLKLHLHQPRPHRVELDVHNVRAAELVLHAERIKRHCAGMEKNLTDVGQRFKAMSEEHNKLAIKFKKDIEALEEIFVNATKSARLVKLQNHITVELDKFMSVIRTSLRQFRQHLDETLQTLRESNARFIKSFRLFSDGGNFCPDEITMYRKKLERMSLMIDSTEGSVMSDLEGMESRYLETATKIAVDFEDRFKSHMNDLAFMESISHWLTNAQVKIKSEVSKCNTQAQNLTQMMHHLQSKVSAHEKPHFDKEKVSASQLNDALPAIFDAFVKHSEYLHCLKTTASATEGSTVSFKTAMNFDGKLGRGANESSIAIIKNIYKSLETSKSKVSDEQGASKKGVGSNKEAEADDSAVEKRRLSDANKPNRKGGDTDDVTTRKSQSGRISKVAKTDKKNVFLQDKIENQTEGKQDDKYFLSSVRNTLKETLDGLLATGEVFYNQKGTRLVTRPQAIPDTFEQCSEILSQKMQSYYYQADEYQNKLLHEFHGQLTKFEQICAHVPRLVIADLLKVEIQRSIHSQNKLSKGFNITLYQLTEKQKLIQNELRPSLGHPQHADELAALYIRGKEQNEEYLEVVKRHIKERQKCALEHARVFFEQLVNLSESQLQKYDGMSTIDDVVSGRAEPVSHSTCELIRYLKAEKLPQSEEVTDVVQRGKSSWIGIPSNQFVIGEKPDILEVTPTVQTQKATMAHHATVKARNDAYDDYKEYFERSLQEIEEISEKIITSATNWEKSWETSIKTVKRLYQK